MWRSERLLPLLVILLTTLPLFSEKLAFKYQAGVKYKMVTTVEGDVFLNGEWDHHVETLYKISVEITAVDGNAGQLSGIFQTSEKASREDALYRLSDEVHTATYWRDARGKYLSSHSQLLPQIRDVPLFPEEAVEIGDSWEAPGVEIFDLAEFGIPEPIQVPLKVQYIYIKNETRQGIPCAVFQIYYAFVLNLGAFAGPGSSAPLKITGHSSQKYYFDIANGRPYTYEDTFSTLYIFPGGDVFELSGKSRGEVTEGTELDKEKMVEEIEQIIADEGIPDTAVTSDADGVRIILEDIHFLPDSDRLLPAEQEKLRQIARILSRYPDRDLLISGHTALAGTPAGRLRLSEQRARAVGEFLLNSGVRRASQMVFKGYGAEQPVAGNDTAAGMKKNRRVEIKILEN